MSVADAIKTFVEKQAATMAALIPLKAEEQLALDVLVKEAVSDGFAINYGGKTLVPGTTVVPTPVSESRIPTSVVAEQPLSS